MAGEEQLDDIAAELSVLAPAAFIAARNAITAKLAHDAGGRGGATLAAAVKALRKPVVSAWAVNLLTQGGGLVDALALAAELREAQDDLDGPELTRLGAQRRALVGALATEAIDLARQHGVTLGGAVRDDVGKTINAAVMDATAAAAVSTGRLVRPLSASGSDTVDVTDAVNGSLAGVAPTPPPRRDDLAQRRARKAAEQAARDADRAHSDAQRALSRADAHSSRARERADLLAERLDDLRRELDRLTADAAHADAETQRLDLARGEAAQVAAAASRAADAARSARDR